MGQLKYESEISRVLSDELMKFYGVSKFSAAYRIFLMRFFIEHIEQYNKIRHNKFEFGRLLMRFLVTELNLPLIGEKLIYKGEEIVLFSGQENSLSNIIDNWMFQNTFAENKKGEQVINIDDIRKELEGVIGKAKKLTKVNKSDPSYFVFLKYNCLKILNETYNINPQYAGRIEGFEYSYNHNDFAFTLEEKYTYLVQARKIVYENFDSLSEEKLEDYLANNLWKIEDGLTLIARQLSIENGRLDIFAKDKNGNYCIIELKVEDDIDICWQCLYYPIAIKNRYGSRPRMIVVVPKLPYHILEPLKRISDVEIFVFNAKIEQGKIADLKLKKLAAPKAEKQSA